MQGEGDWNETDGCRVHRFHCGSEYASVGRHVGEDRADFGATVADRLHDDRHRSVGGRQQRPTATDDNTSWYDFRLVS